METENEWEYLTGFIQTLSGLEHTEYYIGLRNESGEFRWLSNNAPVPGKRWRWQSSGPSGDGRCVVMYKSYLGEKGHFNDLRCDSRKKKGIIRGFICERTEGEH